MKTNVIKIGFMTLLVASLFSLASCNWFKSKSNATPAATDSLSVKDSLTSPKTDSLKVETADSLKKEVKNESKGATKDSEVKNEKAKK